MKSSEDVYIFTPTSYTHVKKKTWKFVMGEVCQRGVGVDDSYIDGHSCTLQQPEHLSQWIVNAVDR